MSDIKDTISEKAGEFKEQATEKLSQLKDRRVHAKKAFKKKQVK